MSRSPAVVVVVVALAMALFTGPPVAASCAGPITAAGAAPLLGQLDGAAVVFVGLVVGTSNSDRVARVKVETVWKGDGIPTYVTVSGTPAGGGAATSVDRTFTVGHRYLFAPYSGPSPYQDNSCSPTQEYSASLDALRPANAHPPTPGSDGLDPTGLAFLPLSTWVLASAAALAAVILLGTLLVRNRRGRLQRSRHLGARPS